MHPSRFTWQSDLFLTVAPSEPIAGRTPMQALLAHFGTATAGGDDIKMDMATATDLAPAILAKKLR